MLKKGLLVGTAAALAVAMACGGDSKTPVSPTTATVADGAAAADGSTLKVLAPTVFQPTAGTVIETLTPNLVVNVTSGKFVASGTLWYRFVVETASGTEVYRSEQVPVLSGTSFAANRVPENVLQYETAYRWKARAEQGTAVGPWSAVTAFQTYAKPVDPFLKPGYITATEVWDPLTKGVTIGKPVNMEFIQDKGARTVGNDSYIQYDLLQTMSSGEFSFFVDNLNPLSAGDKTKLMSMSEGTGDITTNDYRFTIEKRGASYPSPGQVRWRMITGDSGDHGRINDGGPWQPVLDKTKTYFVRATWGNNLITLKIQEYNTATKTLGAIALNVSDDYTFTYKPTPHMAFIGAPAGRAGTQDASVSNMTVRGVYIGTAGKRPDALTIMGIDE